MLNYTVISVFLAAFGWYWYATGGFQHALGNGPYILMGLSAVGYLAVRALLFQAKRKNKIMKQNALKQRDLRERAAKRAGES